MKNTASYSVARASLVAQLQGFPSSSVGKESTFSVIHAGDVGSIPGLGRSPGRGHGNPLQYSCLGKSHGQRSLTRYSPQGCKQSDMTEVTEHAQVFSKQRLLEPSTQQPLKPPPALHPEGFQGGHWPFIANVKCASHSVMPQSLQPHGL